MCTIIVKSQLCEEDTIIARHGSFLERHFARKRLPVDIYMNEARSTDHDPEDHCDIGSSHCNRPNKLSHLMNLIAEAHGHKDRIQKNDVHDILSCADYKGLYRRRPQKLLFVIRAFLTCFVLLRNDTCNIFAHECKMTQQLSTADGQYSCRLFNTLFLWHFDKLSEDDTDMTTHSSATCLVLPSFRDFDKIDMSALNISGNIVIFGNSDDRPLCFHSNYSLQDINLSGSVPPGYPTEHNFFQVYYRDLSAMYWYFYGENLYLVIPCSAKNKSSSKFPSHNNYVMIKYTQEETIIDTPRDTEVLNMSHNRIKDFEINASVPLEYLRHMDLSDNLISEFHVNMSSMTNLEYLDLSSNKLSSLSSTTITQLNEIAALHDKKTLTIDIGGNNLLCTCDTMDFVKWVLHSHPTNIKFVNGDHYTCTDRHSKQVTFHELSLFALIVGCCIAYLLYVVIGIIIIVVGVYAFKRRYRLCHLWYKIRKRCQHRDYNQQQHKYDAFVCFHKDDSNWIESEVKERLKRFKIVYGEEEVEFGQSLPNVISQYIKESHRSILILSPAFVYSQNNSMFYANLIRENLMDTGNDTVIVVKLKPLNHVGLDRTLAELMEHRLCLEWKEDNQDAQDYFWEQLLDALQRPCEELYDTPQNDRTRLLHQ